MTFYRLGIFYFIRSSGAQRLRTWAPESDLCSNADSITTRLCDLRNATFSLKLFSKLNKVVRTPSSKAVVSTECRQTTHSTNWVTVCIQSMSYFLKVSWKLSISLIQSICLVPWYYKKVRFYCLRNSKRKVHRQEGRNTERC